MCHLLSDKHGYICGDCYHELIEWCINAKSIDDEVIKSFMHLPKPAHLDLSKAVREVIQEALAKEFVS
jgi:hypothetical protein